MSRCQEEMEGYANTCDTYHVLAGCLGAWVSPGTLLPIRRPLPLERLVPPSAGRSRVVGEWEAGVCAESFPTPSDPFPDRGRVDPSPAAMGDDWRP